MYPIVEKFHLPMTEQTLPTFLHDLDDRGLLDNTLVVWMGEFGRTPKINDNISRDHWPQCYTTLLAGGGVKRGFVYGASDKDAVFPRATPSGPTTWPRRCSICSASTRRPRSTTHRTART